MTVFVLFADTGAHEPAAVMSIWSTQELAEAEKRRVESITTGPSYYYSITSAEVDLPSSLDEYGWLSQIQSA